MILCDYNWNSNLKDLNSSFYIWFRWSLLFNQVFWLFVMLGGISSDNNKLAVAGYCLSIFPSLLFIGAEAIIPYIPYDRTHKGLHHLDWIVWRLLVILFAIIFLIIWLAKFDNCFTALVWLTSGGLLIIENWNSYRYNNKCCGCMMVSEMI